MNWDRWIGTIDGQPIMRIKHLAHWLRCRIDLHAFVRPDEPGCFHTHPAYAIRIVLWNGYVEELESGVRDIWWPGRIGLIRPELTHRIDALRNDRPSYSLWLRGPCIADIKLRGPGWPSKAIQ